MNKSDLNFLNTFSLYIVIPHGILIDLKSRRANNCEVLVNEIHKLILYYLWNNNKIRNTHRVCHINGDDLGYDVFLPFTWDVTLDLSLGCNLSSSTCPSSHNTNQNYFIPDWFFHLRTLVKFFQSFLCCFTNHRSCIDLLMRISLRNFAAVTNFCLNQFESQEKALKPMLAERFGRLGIPSRLSVH